MPPETQLHNAKAAAIALIQQRAQTEHAIAHPDRPAAGGRHHRPWARGPCSRWRSRPACPRPCCNAGLTWRRPSARRRRTSANIGVAVAGYYPDITLTGTGGTETQSIGELFSPQTFFWNAGVSAAETIFNGGLTRAQVKAARAGYDEAVANYRQAVLTAFGQVEDNLAAQRVLAQEQPELQAAVVSADQDCASCRTSTRPARWITPAWWSPRRRTIRPRNAELALEANRLTTTVDLIVALGGGWNADELKKK